MNVTHLLYCRFCAEQKPADAISDLRSSIEMRNEITCKLSCFTNNSLDLAVNHLPETICDVCYRSLNGAYEFLARINISQVVLSNLFSDTISLRKPIESRSKHDYKLSTTFVKEELNIQDQESENSQKEIEQNYSPNIDIDNKDSTAPPPIHEEKYQLNSNDVSWTSVKYICRYCTEKYNNMDVLRKHIRASHGVCFGVGCEECDTTFDSFNEFVEHVRSHTNGLKNYCEHCNNKSDSTNEHIFHVNANHTNPQCVICGEFFPTKTKLHTHTAKYNPVKTKRVKRLTTIEDLTCRICQKVAKCANNLRAHRKLHSDRRRDFFCDRCGKSFFTKGHLVTHKLIHENPDPQVCKICKKTFLTLTRLKKHVKTHNEDRPFQCDECKRRFRLKDHLKGHMITHMDLVPYPCRYCNKAFKFKTILKNHERQHTGDRPYSCPVCAMDFSSWTNCDNHMNRKHRMTFAKTKLTPLGKVPLNPKNCEARKLEMDGEAKEWTEQILKPRKRVKKVEPRKKEVSEIFLVASVATTGL